MLKVLNDKFSGNQSFTNIWLIGYFSIIGQIIRIKMNIFLRYLEGK